MSPIGHISPLQAGALTRIDAPLPKSPLTPSGPITGTPHDGFGQVLDGLVATVASKQGASQELTKKVLLGESDQLHQSVIAMQEASVAFSMMVEVRNKLVESYQELMRMQV
jgi:flagellar hook-basal body complex protein FliE